MTFKGIVSSIEDTGARVVFPDRGKGVSIPYKIADHVTNLQVGDNVAVLLFLGVSDGIIVAKI